MAGGLIVSCPVVPCLRRFFTRVTNTFISVNESLAEYGFMVGAAGGAPGVGVGLWGERDACMHIP